jgi:hypothetical protein
MNTHSAVRQGFFEGIEQLSGRPGLRILNGVMRRCSLFGKGAGWQHQITDPDIGLQGATPSHGHDLRNPQSNELFQHQNRLGSAKHGTNQGQRHTTMGPDKNFREVKSIGPFAKQWGVVQEKLYILGGEQENGQRRQSLLTLPLARLNYSLTYTSRHQPIVEVLAVRRK